MTGPGLRAWRRCTACRDPPTGHPRGRTAQDQEAFARLGCCGSGCGAAPGGRCCSPPARLGLPGGPAAPAGPSGGR